MGTPFAPFDPTVFDSGTFDTGVPGMVAVPAVLKVSVPEIYRFVTGHQSIPITVYIVNALSTAGKRYLFNPTAGPGITIFDPNNTILIDSFAMTNLLEIGVYHYDFQHDFNVNGIFTARFTAANADNVMASRKYFICHSKAQNFTV